MVLPFHLLRRWHALLACAAALGTLALVPAMAAEPVMDAPPEWRVELIKLPEIASTIGFGRRVRLDQLRITGRSGVVYDLDACAEGYCANAFGRPPPSSPPDNLFPGSRVAEASGTQKGLIQRVWLAEPVQRLGDGVLGAVNAGSLVAVGRMGRKFNLDLPVDQAFEDLAPRLVDIDKDGKPEIVVVKSRVGLGASLAVIGLAEDGFHIRAESPPPGVPNAGLKLAGIADYTGGGGVEFAVVRNPGADGIIEIWRYIEGYIQATGIAVANVSNHAPGLTATDMSVTGDLSGDKVADLAIPTADRQAIRILGFRNGAAVEYQRIALPAPIVTDIVTLANDGARPTLIMGLDDGTLAVLGRPGG